MMLHRFDYWFSLTIHTAISIVLLPFFTPHLVLEEVGWKLVTAILLTAFNPLLFRIIHASKSTLTGLLVWLITSLVFEVGVIFALSLITLSVHFISLYDLIITILVYKVIWMFLVGILPRIKFAPLLDTPEWM